MSARLPGALDHLILGTPDLARTVDALEARLGVRARPGGSHPGHGTRNALIGLGPRSYLEVMGPDPEQPAPPRRWLGIDELSEPRLVAWVVADPDLEARVARARAADIHLGAVRAGSRRRDDGGVLSWRLTDPEVAVGDRLVPFFIDWGASPHPAAGDLPSVELLELRAEHPRAAAMRELLAGVAVDLTVETGPVPALIASLRTPRGVVELR